ncbi:MAG: phosphoribosyl-AMP cyclohydrolase [Acetobacteraceae bacterium]|nr:phosphoribosyl-AMP cyclohydrolase [Acetobacteraceae bacterium]
MVEGLRFDERGLVPVVTQDAGTGEVLMLAYADAEAVERTLRTGWAHYFSRERGRLWKKGETSGHVQRVVEVRQDCDGDALLFRVRPAGPACHTGARSCFGAGGGEELGALAWAGELERLWAVIQDRARRPVEGSRVCRLLSSPSAQVLRKVAEEAVEAALAGVSG